MIIRPRWGHRRGRDLGCFAALMSAAEVEGEAGEREEGCDATADAAADGCGGSGVVAT